MRNYTKKNRFQENDRVAQGVSRRASQREKDAKLVQKLGQLQPFIVAAVLPHERAWANLASF